MIIVIVQWMILQFCNRRDAFPCFKSMASCVFLCASDFVDVRFK